MNFNRKIKASSMYYALFLSVVIGVLLSGTLLFSHMNRSFVSQLELEKTLMQNANSGIEYGLANYQEMPLNEPKHIRLFHEGIDSVCIKRKRWGAFTIIESSAIHQNLKFSKMVLAGELISDQLSNLFVADLGRPVALCGDTKLQGKIQIPESGLKRAYIEGKNFTGGEMIYGTKLVSSRNLPEFNPQIMSELNTVSGKFLEWDEEMDSVQVSFSEEGQHYFSDNTVSLQAVFLDGQIVVESADSIFVGADAVLNHVILKSPVVHFESGFVGSVQVLASEQITLEENVLLKYPSVLSLNEVEFPEFSCSEILIADHAQMIGTVILKSEKPNFRKPVSLVISPLAEIDGLIYCTGQTQLQGTVKGHLYTEKFFLKTQSSNYENHILDGKILNELPADFVAVNILNNSSNLTRIEWLR